QEESTVYDSNRISELQPEAFSFTGEMESETSFSTELESPFSEAEEMELAVELLATTSEAELEQFLGNLFKKAWQGIKTIGSKVLRPLVKTVLPIAATAAGTFFGGPAGGAIGGKLGSLVSQALEAEAAGISPEDRDLEKCRQFVRMAATAARAAALAPPGANPVAVVQRVLADAAQRTLTMGAPGAAPTASAPQPPPLGLPGAGPAAAAPRPPTLGAPSAAPAAAAQRIPTLGIPGAAPAAAGGRCRCGQPWNCTCGQSGQ